MIFENIVLFHDLPMVILMEFYENMRILTNLDKIDSHIQGKGKSDHALCCKNVLCCTEDLDISGLIHFIQLKRIEVLQTI